MRYFNFFILYAIPYIALYLYRDKKGINLFRVNVSNLLMLFYFLANHIGLAWLFINTDGVKQLNEINQDAVILLAFYSIVVVFAYIFSGLTLGRRFCDVRIPDVRALYDEKINFIPIIIFVLIAIPISALKVLSDSPLLILLSGNPIEANFSRKEAVTIGSSFLNIKESYVNIIYKILGYGLVIIMVMALTKKRVKYIAIYAFIFFITSAYWFSNVSKGFIVEPIYSLIFTYALLFNKGRLLNKMLIIGIIIVASVVSIFTSWVMGNSTVDYWYPFERFLLGNLIPQYVVINSFDFDNLLYGASTPNWYSFWSHEQFRIDIFAWKEIFGWSGGELFYSAPSSFVAEAHANFHIFGVIIWTFVIFYVFRLTDFLIKKIKSEMVYISILVYSSINLTYISISPAAGIFFDYYYIGVLIFALYIYPLFGHRLNLNKKYNYSPQRTL